jgi:predicted nuclease of predicted toxin-antitoxin system
MSDSLGSVVAPDEEIWNCARDNGFGIVSKDSDFRERSYVGGYPPKVIWLDVGNAGTAAIAALFKAQQQRIERLRLPRSSRCSSCRLGHPRSDPYWRRLLLAELASKIDEALFGGDGEMLEPGQERNRHASRVIH